MKAAWESRTWSAPLADESYRVDVWSRIQKAIEISSAGCWEWQQWVTSDGYGVVSVKKRMVRSHQVTLAIHLGYIWSTEFQVDHLCRNRACCNPEHLELVTPRENTARGRVAEVAGQLQRAKTHCPLRHPYDEANTYIHPVRGGRRCRACRTLTERRRKAAMRSAA